MRLLRKQTLVCTLIPMFFNFMVATIVVSGDIFTIEPVVVDDYKVKICDSEACTGFELYLERCTSETCSYSFSDLGLSSGTYWVEYSSERNGTTGAYITYE